MNVCKTAKLWVKNKTPKLPKPTFLKEIKVDEDGISWSGSAGFSNYHQGSSNYEIRVVLQGSGYLHVDQTEWRLRPGGSKS